MTRRWLIALSLVAHLAAAAGLFVSGIWQLERLHAAPLAFKLHTLDLPAPAGKLVARSQEPVKPKVTVLPPNVLVQPVVKPRVKQSGGPEIPPSEIGTGNGPESRIDDTCVSDCGPGPAAAPVCGNSAREAGEDCDDGNQLDGDGCSSTCRSEPKKPQPVSLIAPNVLQGLRIAGDTAVHPSTSTQTLMMRDGADKVVGTIKICIATDGSIASASLQRSTRYPDYDAKLVTAARDWRYRPYTLNGAPVPVCSMVTFIYRTR